MAQHRGVTLLKLSNFICSDKKDRYRWIGPWGGPRENAPNLAGRQEQAPSCGAKGGNILLKLCPENRVNGLVLHIISHLAVGPNICSESRLACSIWVFHLEKLKGYYVEHVWWCETDREEERICVQYVDQVKYRDFNLKSTKCNSVDFRQPPRKFRPTRDKSNFSAAIKHQTQMKNSEQ